MNSASWQIISNALGLWPWAIIAPLYLYVQLRGDGTARAFGAILAVALLLGTVLPPRGISPSGVADVRLGVDALFLAVQYVFCLRSRWNYPLLITAAQLLVVLVESITATSLAGRPATDSVLLFGLTAIQFAAFLYGVVVHRNRRPLWQARRRAENASSDLAPRANGAR
ncbi:MAG: hypothetical protein ACKOOL_12525 [Novosphingobium sp.]